MVFFGELVWKPLLSHPRPVGSCVFTCGMPSSHATISMGFLTWMLLEGILRNKRRGTAIYAPEAERPEETRRRAASYWEDAPPTVRITLKERWKWCVVWAILLFPVPFSRVALYDHSWAQVTAGSFIGCFEAVMFYVLLNRFGAYLDVFLVENWCLRNGKTCGICSNPFFHNNYEPNHFLRINTLVRANRALARNARATALASIVPDASNDENRSEELLSPYEAL